MNEAMLLCFASRGTPIPAQRSAILADDICVFLSHCRIRLQQYRTSRYYRFLPIISKSFTIQSILRCYVVLAAENAVKYITNEVNQREI
jgi:hypothetical protein